MVTKRCTSYTLISQGTRFNCKILILLLQKVFSRVVTFSCFWGYLSFDFEWWWGEFETSANVHFLLSLLRIRHFRVVLTLSSLILFSSAFGSLFSSILWKLSIHISLSQISYAIQTAWLFQIQSLNCQATGESFSAILIIFPFLPYMWSVWIHNFDSNTIQLEIVNKSFMSGN